MKQALRRLLQAVRFERDAFVWMDFEDRATGDALVLVAVSRLLIQLGFGYSLLGLTTSLRGLELVLNIAITAAVFWLAYSGLVHAISKFLLDGEGSYATVLRITGFAFPTLLLLIVSVQIFGNDIVALLVGSVWFLAVVAHGVRYAAGLALQRAALAAGGGLLGWIIIVSILNRPLI